MTEDEELPLQHIIRPKLPWRSEARDRTECGRKPDAHALTRPAAIAKVKRQGQTRAALTTCMTCWEAAARHPDWDDAPSMVVKRYIKNAWFLPPSSRGVVQAYRPESDTVTLDQELRAVWALIQRHPEEWAELLYVEGLPDEVAARRQRRAR